MRCHNLCIFQQFFWIFVKKFSKRLHWSFTWTIVAIKYINVCNLVPLTCIIMHDLYISKRKTNKNELFWMAGIYFTVELYWATCGLLAVLNMYINLPFTHFHGYMHLVTLLFVLYTYIHRLSMVNSYCRLSSSYDYAIILLR